MTDQNTPAAAPPSVPPADDAMPPAVGVASKGDRIVQYVGHHYDGECDYCTPLGPYHSNFGMLAVRRMR